MGLATSVDDLRTVWQHSSLVQRLLAVAYLLVGLSAAAPWVRGRPFMDGFWGSPETGPITTYGYEAAGPLFVVAGLGLAALVLLTEARRRRQAQVAAWLLLAVPALGLGGWTEFLCFLCSQRELLAGFRVFQAAAGLGAVLSIVDMARGDPAPVPSGLEDEAS